MGNHDRATNSSLDETQQVTHSRLNKWFYTKGFKRVDDVLYGSYNDDDYNVLFWASNRLSYCYKGSNLRREPPEEPEVVYYHVDGNPQCLAIQGHPEIMRKESPVINILNDLIDKGVYNK